MKRIVLALVLSLTCIAAHAGTLTGVALGGVTGYMLGSSSSNNAHAAEGSQSTITVNSDEILCASSAPNKCMLGHHIVSLGQYASAQGYTSYRLVSVTVGGGKYLHKLRVK